MGPYHLINADENMMPAFLDLSATVDATDRTRSCFRFEIVAYVQHYSIMTSA